MKKLYRVFVTIILFLGALGIPYPGKAAPPEQEEEPPVAPDPAAPLVLDTIDDFGYTYLLSPDPLLDENPIVTEDPWWVNPEDYTMVDVFPNGIPPGNLILSSEIKIQEDQSLPVPVDCSGSPPTDCFKFPFYENTYSSIKVSVNGTIRLEANQEAGDVVNYPLPTGNIVPAAPTNIIAPLWADLGISLEPGITSEIKYRYFSDNFPYAGKKALVIEWINMVRADTSDLFSFGVVLQDLGGIWILLKDLPISTGNLTIGIQDKDGEDGLMYYYPGSTNVIGDLKAVKINKPSPNFHVKANPTVMGSFTQDGKAFLSFQLRNNTDLLTGGVDSYDISYLVNEGLPCELSSCWRAQFLTENWNGLLPNNNTGPVTKGDTYNLNMRIYAPDNAEPGDHAKITIIATSVNSISSLAAQSIVQVAVPTGFAGAYSDNAGARASMIWSLNQSVPRISDGSTNNNNLALEDYDEGFIMAWVDPTHGVSYAFLSEIGAVKYKRIDIQPLNGDNDRFPAIGVDPVNGQTGLAWARQTGSGTEIWFAILDPSLPAPGIRLMPRKLSATMPWGLSTVHPAVESLGSGIFLVAWPQFEPDGDDLYIARVNISGAVTGPVKKFDSLGNIVGISLEKTPGWINKEAVISFINTENGSIALYYASINGTSMSNPVNLSTTPSSNSLSTTQTSVAGNRILLSWIDKHVGVVSKSGIAYFDQGVKYTIISESDLINPAQVYEEMSPNRRQADYVSAGSDKDGNGILIWSDYRIGSQFYYMLVDPDDPASPVTPPMIYKTAVSGSINPSSSGQSLALFGGHYQTALPVTRK